MKCPLTRSRAIDDTEKAARKASILESARRLFQARTDSLPSVISIAQEAGLAKGTVYLYFKTKEEIFLNLLARDYATLIEQLEQVASCTAPKVSEQNLGLIAALVNQVVEFAERHPEFMPLATMASSVLEQNTDVEQVLEFKAMLVRELDRLASELTRQIPALSHRRCMELLIHTNALILGLWQMQNLPPAVDVAVRQRSYDILIPDFAPTLRDAMTLLWEGALSQSHR